ncbi:MAG: MBL fold metallo-hydrolase [Promethearchaeota archaeon]|nr:MAG: MBL fold metallo-hydrolase [Candidatus Lokiarchaeota archaeon]
MFSFSGSSKKPGRKVIDNLYYFAEQQMLDCNQYVIQNQETDELFLFDAGNGKSLKGLFEGMDELGLDPKHITSVYLTHEHIDHVIGLYPLLNTFQDDPPEIFAYGETAKILKQGNTSKIFPGNLGISPQMFGVDIRPIEVTEITTEETIKINSQYEFNIYHTPGHSQGSVCYYEPSEKVLIPGDLVFSGGSIGRYDFPGSSLKSLQNSIKFVAENLDVKYLLPGHMQISTQGNQSIQMSYRMVQSAGRFF